MNRRENSHLNLTPEKSIVMFDAYTLKQIYSKYALPFDILFTYCFDVNGTVEPLE